jgi:hypothetical protein
MITEKAHQRYPPSQTQREKGDKAMIARFDHRPMLTALLALTTTVLVVVVVTLSTLLITAAPPAATSSSESGGANAGAAVAVPGTHANYGEGWNNYGHDEALPQPAQAGNGADSAIDRHAEVVAAYGR